MITLMFEKAGQYFIITIENKKILYWDKLQGKLWGGPLQYLPPDPKNSFRIMSSRNRIPAMYIDMLKITDSEMVEFEKAKDDNELKQIVLRDAKKNGCNLLKES